MPGGEQYNRNVRPILKLTCSSTFKGKLGCENFSSQNDSSLDQKNQVSGGNSFEIDSE